MPFVQLTGNARTHGFVTGNPERHGGLQGYCDRKENEANTVRGIPDAQSSPARGVVAGEGSAPPPPVSLVPTPVAGRGASRPPWHRSAARAPLTLTSSVSALLELTRATPPRHTGTHRDAHPAQTAGPADSPAFCFLLNFKFCFS